MLWRNSVQKRGGELMIYKLIESQQMVLEDPSRHFLKECLIMDKYLSAVNNENRQALFDIHSIVGYCKFEGHPVLMTISDYKTHHCANKKCPLFQPYKSFPYRKKHKIELSFFQSDPALIKKAEEEKAKSQRVRTPKAARAIRTARPNSEFKDLHRATFRGNKYL